MNVLSHPDRERLIGCLRLFSRPGTLGERDAAFAAAVRILHARNLDWDDVIVLSENPSNPQERAEQWRNDIEICIRNLSRLSRWERDFIINLRGFRRLSPKQSAVLHDIVERVQTARGAA